MEKKSLRYNQGKPQPTYLSYEALEPMLRVLEYGDKKYTVEDENGNVVLSGRNNWRKGFDKLGLLNSLQRHVGELIDNVNEGREEIDPESQEHLIGHILCNAMFYSYHHVMEKKSVKQNEVPVEQSKFMTNEC